MKNKAILLKYQAILEDIKNYSPHPEKVTVLAVSKGQSIEDIETLYEYGVRDFGENRVKEFLTKHEALLDRCPEIRWHFIGHVQSKKIKHIIDKVYLIQSLDSIHLAEKLELHAEKIRKKVNVLLEVNIAREEQKYGLFTEEISGFIHCVKHFSFLNIMGMMTMAPYTQDMEICKDVFKQASGAFQALKKEVHLLYELPYLSMGMSNDYQIALKNGATMIRIGSSLFH